MNSKKAIILLIAAYVLVASAAGIAFAQYVGTQTNEPSFTSQSPQGTPGTNNLYPQQGYYPYSSTQNSYPYGYGRGMGMCGRFW